MPSVIRIIFALVVSLAIPLGLWIAYKGALMAVEASQSTTWPTAPGQIVASHVRTSVSHGRHHGTSYTPVIDYTYLVAGTTYTGTMIAPGRNWGSKSSYAAVNAHVSGTKADVRYDPAQPSTSVLEPGLHAVSFGQTLGGFSIATFAAIFALVVTHLVPTGDGRSRFRNDTIGGKMVLPLVGLLIAEIVAMIWIS